MSDAAVQKSEKFALSKIGVMWEDLFKKLLEIK